MVHIAFPGDPAAEKWLDRYEEYDEVRSRHSAVITRMYSWLHEPHVWVMGGVTAVMAGLLLQLPGLLVVVIGGLLAAYWLWACTHTPRVVRMYRELSAELRILHMAELMLELYAQELPKLEDGSKPDAGVRFVILGGILRDHSVIVTQVTRDCGCQAPCYHEGRLLVDTRRCLRRKLRKLIAAQLKVAALAGNNPVRRA